MKTHVATAVAYGILVIGQTISSPSTFTFFTTWMETSLVLFATAAAICCLDHPLKTVELYVTWFWPILSGICFSVATGITVILFYGSAYAEEKLGEYAAYQVWIYNAFIHYLPVVYCASLPYTLPSRVVKKTAGISQTPDIVFLWVLVPGFAVATYLDLFSVEDVYKTSFPPWPGYLVMWGSALVFEFCVLLACKATSKMFVLLASLVQLVCVVGVCILWENSTLPPWGLVLFLLAGTGLFYLCPELTKKN